MFYGEQQENWHAVFVETGVEDKVKERLLYRYNDRFKVVVPKRKLKERKNGIWSFNTRILFPGYVMLQGDIDQECYYSFKDIPGVLRLLRSGNDILAIDPEEMVVLSRLMCNGEIIGFSNVLVENGKVRVVDGPLLSMEGIILDINHRKGRARVRLDFLGSERTVELGVSVLRPVE